MGHKFSLVLSREITSDESALLQEAGCNGAVFAKDTLPTDASVPVTKMDIDDTLSPSLAEAIESALQAVTKVPDLSVPGLTVPAVLPADVPEDSPAGAATVIAGDVIEEPPAATEAPVGKAAGKKAGAKKSSAKKPVTVAANGSDVGETADGSD